MRSKHENMYNKQHTIKTNKTHSLNSTKYTQTVFEYHIFQNSTKTQNPRNQRFETWNTLRKIESPYLFLKIGEEMMKKNGVFESEHGEFRRGRQWTVKICEGKLKSLLKTVLKKTLNVQNTRFSRLEWVANKLPKTRVTKFENFV